MISIAAMMQSHIYESIQYVVKEKFEEFIISPELPSHEGGLLDMVPSSILSNETLHDTDLRVHILSGRVPTVYTIFRFVFHWVYFRRLVKQCKLYWNLAM